MILMQELGVNKFLESIAAGRAATAAQPPALRTPAGGFVRSTESPTLTISRGRLGDLSLFISY